MVRCSPLFPRAERPPNRHQLADVIRVVVDHENQFAEVRLAGPVRNCCEQIDLWISREILQRAQIAIVDELVSEGLVRLEAVRIVRYVSPDTR